MVVSSLYTYCYDVNHITNKRHIHILLFRIPLEEHNSRPFIKIRASCSVEELDGDEDTGRYTRTRTHMHTHNTPN